MATIHELKSFQVFHGLDDDELNRIAPLIQERSLDKGARCSLQGTDARELHLCRSGKVDIVIQHFEVPSVYVKIHTAMAGEAFGWSALVEPYKYTASALCADKTDEFYLRQTDLFKLFDNFPRIGYVLMKNLAALISSRVTDYSKRLSKDIALDTRDDYEW
ncbi:MAG: cyclic nucleotide-binding domain-containing protein [Deltaproteobacteria bacterium]|nr:cyclic nucleotide-binding domain-containing protein [Deltaproteobacteria bacterium]